MINQSKCIFFKLDSSITIAKDDNIQEIEQSPPINVPKGGYNLDFLDNLDDPNFNPFETKSKVVVAFGASDNKGINQTSEDIAKEINTNDVSEAATKKRVSTTTKKKILTKKKETESDANKEEKPEKPKKVMPPKPWLMKKSLKLKNMQESENISSINEEFNIEILAPSVEPKTGNLIFDMN